MIIGMSVLHFTILHVALSLVGIVTGLVAVIALARKIWLPAWHHVFLTTTLATVVTGFLFPINGITPALAVGGLSLVVLVAAYVAFFNLKQNAIAGRAYATSAMIALYFNLFVLIAQGFLKVPFLTTLAPTQTELPFVLAQLLLLVGSVALGVSATSQVRQLP